MSEGRLTTDDTGRALFLAPPQPGTLTAQLPNGPSFTTNLTAAGRHEIVMPEPAPEAPVIDLMEALRQSVAAASEPKAPAAGRKRKTKTA